MERGSRDPLFQGSRIHDAPDCRSGACAARARNLDEKNRNRRTAPQTFSQPSRGGLVRGAHPFRFQVPPEGDLGTTVQACFETPGRMSRAKLSFRGLRSKNPEPRREGTATGALSGPTVLTAPHPGFRDQGWPAVRTAGTHQQPVVVPADGICGSHPGRRSADPAGTGFSSPAPAHPKWDAAAGTAPASHNKTPRVAPPRSRWDGPAVLQGGGKIGIFSVSTAGGRVRHKKSF